MAILNTKSQNDDDIRLEMLHNFGAFEYSNYQIAALLKQDVHVVEQTMKDKNSELYRCYEYGKQMREYVIDQKLFDLVQVGDMAALREFEKRRKR